jgi:hypothetical protein
MSQTYNQHHIKLEKIKTFSLKSGIIQGYPLSPLLLSIILKFLVRKIKQEKEIKRIHIGKEKLKLFLFAAYLVLFADIFYLIPERF